MIADIGDRIWLTATWTDADSGDAVTPEDVTCTVLAPDGTTTTPTVTLDGNAATVSLVVDASGRWRYRFAWPDETADEGFFDVRRQSVPSA